jgi:hypothetical protein
MNVVFGGTNRLQHAGIGFVAAGKRDDAVSIEERMIRTERVDRSVQFTAKSIFNISHSGAEVEVPCNEGVLGCVLGIPPAYHQLVGRPCSQPFIRNAINAERKVKQGADYGKGPGNEHPQNGCACVAPPLEGVQAYTDKRRCMQNGGGHHPKFNMKSALIHSPMLTGWIVKA